MEAKRHCKGDSESPFCSECFNEIQEKTVQLYFSSALSSQTEKKFVKITSNLLLTIYRKHPLQKNFHNLMSKGKTRIMISFSLHIFIDWLEFFPSVISLKLFDWSVRIIWKFCHLMDEHDVQKILYYVLLIWLTGI